MGYRSDVRIVTSQEGFEKLEEFVKEYLKEYNEQNNLLDDCDIKQVGKKQCYFGWNYIKWYDGYHDVDAIMEGLEYLSENEYSYRYMIIGESYDDIEEKFYDGVKDEKIYLEYPNIIREFDDDYVLKSIQGKQLDNIEQDKDEIDI